MRKWFTALLLGLFLVAFGYSQFAFADDEGHDPSGHVNHDKDPNPAGH